MHILPEYPPSTHRGNFLSLTESTDFTTPALCTTHLILPTNSSKVDFTVIKKGDNELPILSSSAFMISIVIF